MARNQKEIVSNVCEGESWYIVPSYKVMLVRDSGESVKMAGKKFAVKNPDDMAEIFRSYLDGVDREHFVVAMLDQKGNVLGLNTVSIGSVSASVVHPREVFKPAIVMGSSSIIVAHNHPSGDTAPSREDIDVTNKLVEGGKLLGIEVLDHVIIGDGYCSLKARGFI
jgi:DNA repair protein RadC